MANVRVAPDTDLALARCVETLTQKPAALLFDFDGVLSELVDQPDKATIERRSEAALHQLASMIDMVGIVTGRAAGDVMNRLDATELVVIGNHGLEHVVAGEHVEHEAGVEAAETIEAAIADIRTRLERDALLEGVIFENKRLSASIHYRMAPNPRQVGSILAPLARHAASEHGLRMSEGKNIVELRPLAEVTKGTAIRQLWADGTFGSMVFLGDDLTDVDGFIALQDLRATGNVATLAVGVLGADSHDRVAETADVAVSGVTGVSDLLERLVTSLKASPNE